MLDKYKSSETNYVKKYHFGLTEGNTLVLVIGKNVYKIYSKDI